MDMEILMEIEDIQTELTGGIGLIAVIADGLGAFSRDSCLSGESRRRYVDALYGTFDALSAVNGKLRERLDRAREGAS
ncbi:hypothetical protein [uncultured Oscillibacter sp.]|uniref:hypothetical protein n=1 Tax=uncultured Oscillibacter sp. TaxID=876091 RepID=UPI0025D1EE40|nr:hypothetical protein [uncultured Oscillibacter sp.]